MTDQIEDISIEKAPIDSNKIIIKSKTGYSCQFFVNNIVTGNCQMFIIEQFKTIINEYNKKEDVLLILKEAFKQGEKPFALIDINEVIYEKFQKLDILKENNIIFNTPYKSTNESQMRIIGFHLGLEK